MASSRCVKKKGQEWEEGWGVKLPGGVVGFGESEKFTVNLKLK